MEKEGLANILQLSHELSNENRFEQLLHKIVTICLKHTEAERCLILENQEGKLLIQAEGSTDKDIEVMQNIPVESRGRIKRTFILTEKLPLTVIDEVLKSKQASLIEDFSKLSADQYIENFKPNSTYCFPVTYQGQLIAIVYLENHNEGDSFSQETIESLSILTNPIAIAFKNSQKLLLHEKTVKDLEEELIHQRGKVHEFQQNVKLLGEIGQDVAGNRSIEQIISSVYENVNTLMDATLFSIGIYRPTENAIEMPATIEKDQVLPAHSYNLDKDNTLAVWCFKNGKEVFINDFRSEFRKYLPDAQLANPKVGELPDSVIYLPIFVHDEVIGVITVQSFRKYAYSEYHLNILQNLAVYVAIALENANAYQDLETSRKEVSIQNKLIEESSKELAEQKEQIANAYQDFQLLAKLGREITSNLKVKELVSSAHSAISQLMDASIFTLGIYNEAAGTIEMPLTIEDGKSYDFHSYSLTENEHRLAVWCFRNAKEILINDYKNEYNNYFPKVPLAIPKVGELPKSVMYLPVFSQAEPIGVLTVQTLVPSAYTEYHLNFLKNLAVYVGIALENAEAYEKIELSKTEIAEQKKLIEQSYEDIKLLGEIGQDIIANLEVDKIVETVYENVNNLMDAPVFSIGMYNSENKNIEVTGSIENYEKLPFHSYSIDNQDSLSVLCFKEMREVFVSDCQKEYHHYLPDSPLPEKPEVGELPESIIYLPLIGKEGTIGVLTVQSFQKYSYTEYHMNILRNLAIYISIALENADAYRKVEDSKAEVAKQSELLKQSFHSVKLLAEIGQTIISTLSVQKIVETVYESVNTLMDASVFWIGIYERMQNSIEFKGGKEKGETLEDFSISVDEPNRLAAWCFIRQQEVVINDIEKDYQQYLPERVAPVAGDAPESIVYIPLSIKGDQMGVLTIQSFEKNAYTSYHLDILQNLATYICIGLENAKLYQNMEEQVEMRTAQVVMQKEELERQRDQLNKSFKNIKLLSQIGQDITGLLSTDEIIRTAYDKVNDLMDAATFGIGVLEKSGEKIIFRGAIEKGESLPEFFHLTDDVMRFSGWTLKNNDAVFINDFDKEYKKYLPDTKAAAAGGEAESILYLPLSTKNGDIGVLTVQSFNKNAYSTYHLEILKNLAVYIAIAIENAEAYKDIGDFSSKLEKANQKFTSSINYAKRIQEAILPREETIRHYLPESFVFFRPRDIVSGDFYWFTEQHGKIFIAAVDCTGHGVPGAFMSMIGNDLLNEVIVNVGIEEPDYILSEMHMGIRNALRQETTDNRDGMDMSVCVIDKIAQRIDYAGAKSPLVYIKKGEVVVVKPTPMSVGGKQHKSFRNYKKHSISTSNIDAFYLFSDGYQDQFGGEQGRKMRSVNFRELLLKIHKEPMEKQEGLLQEALNNWRGNTRQIDDVLVMGFKV